MNTQVEITNGSGWNNYEALRTLKSLPPGWQSLAKKEGVALIRIQPVSDKPLGFSAEFHRAPKVDENGNAEEFAGSQDTLLYEAHFGQNDSAQWVRDIIMEIMREGIPARLARLALEEAKEAGFSTPEEHQAAKIKATADAKAQREAELAHRDEFNHGQHGGDRAATNAFNMMVEELRKHPTAVRMGRKGQFIDCEEQVLPGGLSHFGMIPWLVQHGFRATIDDRQHFFDAAKEAARA